MTDSVSGSNLPMPDPTPEALDVAETLVNHQWGVSVPRLARALDAFARTAVEKERDRAAAIALEVAGEWREAAGKMAAWQVRKRIVRKPWPGEQP